MAGISDKALKTNYAENKYRYNKGSELQNKEFSDGSGLEMYDAHARSYDPQIGRFIQIDPLADTAEQINLTPYQYGSDAPIRYNDPSGKCPTCILGLVVGAAVDYAVQVSTNLAKGESFGKALSDVDGTEIAISAAAGFATSGVSSIYESAAVSGTKLAISKTAANIIVSGTVSTMNQANKGEPVTTGKTTMDITKDVLSDGLASKLLPKSGETAKGAVSNVISGTLDAGMESTSKPKTTQKAAPVMYNPLGLLVAKPDATTHKVNVPKFTP